MTEHWPPPLRAHDAALKVPAALVAHVTDPVGVVGEPASVSVTVAVQVLASPTETVEGEQTTPVAVERTMNTTDALPVLASCRLLLG